jgi:hypothetical protein
MRVNTHPYPDSHTSQASVVAVPYSTITLACLKSCMLSYCEFFASVSYTIHCEFFAGVSYTIHYTRVVIDSQHALNLTC